jgi:cytochrome c1
MRTVLWTLLTAAGAALAGAAAFVYFGLYDISSVTGHTQPVYSLMEVTMRRSVQVRSADIPLPQDLSAPEVVERGAVCYRDHCVQCHGGPGVAQNDIGKSLQPLPGPLVDAARRWQPQELYWITRHGIKMSGMPAWQMRLPERDLWAVVGFLKALPLLSPADYQARMDAVASQQCQTFSQTRAADPTPPAVRRPPVDPSDRDEVAKLALRQYACTACHTVPGTIDSAPQVGPPLAGFGQRTMIAGRLPNTEDDLVAWLMAPQKIKPGTAMPDMGVTPEHARQMAQYLRALR